MKKYFSDLMTLIRDEQGASATEYSVLVVLIILVALVSISLLGGQVERAFDRFIEVFDEAKSSSS